MIEGQEGHSVAETLGPRASEERLALGRSSSRLRQVEYVLVELTCLLDKARD